MAYNLIQFQHGMSLPEFIQCFGTEGACVKALQRARWPAGFVLPAMRWQRSLRRGQRVAAALPVQLLPRADVDDRRHSVCEHQAAADDVVLGNLAAQPSQDRLVGARTEAPGRRELPDRLADTPQSHEGDGRPRGDTPPVWRG